jgi:uncharacterized FlaG/YvyC family protein
MPNKEAMDIKGIARNLLPFTMTKAASEAVGTRHKTDANNDREGDGQAAASGEEQKRRRMTAEELEDAVKYLEGLAGVKDNHLKIRLETKDDVTVVYVEDRDGKVVRRIPESELRSLTANRERKSGHLINRAL